MMEGWKEIKIKEFCEFKYGKNLPEKKRVPGKYPVYGSSNLAGSHNEFLVEGPGIIIGRKGTVGRVQFSKENFFPIDTTYYVSEDKEQVDLKFLYYRLPLCGFEEMNSDAAVPGLNRSAAISQKINLPPLPTQRKIASILSAYDDLIENNLKRIKLLEEKAQLTYEEWFVRLKFPGHETTPINKETGLPEGWEKKKIGNISKTSSGGTPSRKKEAEYYENGTIPWVRTGELKNFILTDAEYNITESGLKNSSAKLFPKNTVLLAMYGNTIGETSFVTKEVSSNQACCAFLVKDKPFLSYFLHQYLLYNKNYILNYRMGAAQENISQSIVQNIKIIFPKEHLLIAFEKVTKPIYQEIENMIRQNQLFKEARDILLPRLMTGMIDVEQMNLETIEQSIEI